MFFKRKKQEIKPLCFHEWHVADFGVTYEYNGVSEDSCKYYVIGCVKCGSSRTLDELEFSIMKSAGFIKEASE